MAFILALITLMTNTFFAYATETLNSSFTMKDSVGETFRIEVKENVENRTVLLYDSDGDIIPNHSFLISILEY